MLGIYVFDMCVFAVWQSDGNQMKVETGHLMDEPTFRVWPPVPGFSDLVLMLGMSYFSVPSQGDLDPQLLSMSSVVTKS
jgi:hypothetical protein